MAYSSKTGKATFVNLTKMICFVPIPTTLKNTLDSVQDKEERIVGLPKTPEEFQRLPTFLQDHYWHHKPGVQRMLRNHGLEDLDIAKKGPAKAGPSLREKT